MSNAVSGVIQQIDFKQINATGEPNQWGSTHRANIKIDGKWYGGPSVKPYNGQLQLRVQNGKDWVTLKASDSIQFFTEPRESNGKTYYNVKGKIMLTAVGNGPAVPVSATPSSATATPAPASASGAPAAQRPAPAAGADSIQQRVEDGVVFSGAMKLIQENGGDPTDVAQMHQAATLVRAALATYHKVIGRTTSASPIVPLGQTAPTGASPTPAAAAAPVAPAQAAAPVAAPSSATTAAPAPAPVQTQGGISFEDDDIPF